MNHCPVYQNVGGHAYGWVYPGPMGSVLTPLINGIDQAYDLPNACTLNGRCQTVCPVKIPLPGLLREIRRRFRPSRDLLIAHATSSDTLDSADVPRPPPSPPPPPKSPKSPGRWLRRTWLAAAAVPLP